MKQTEENRKGKYLDLFINLHLYRNYMSFKNVKHRDAVTRHFLIVVQFVVDLHLIVFQSFRLHSLL
jgi:hypothetical protein